MKKKLQGIDWPLRFWMWSCVALALWGFWVAFTHGAVTESNCLCRRRKQKDSPMQICSTWSNSVGQYKNYKQTSGEISASKCWMTDALKVRFTEHGTNWVYVPAVANLYFATNYGSSFWEVDVVVSGTNRQYECWHWHGVYDDWIYTVPYDSQLTNLNFCIADTFSNPPAPGVWSILPYFPEQETDCVAVVQLSGVTFSNCAQSAYPFETDLAWNVNGDPNKKQWCCVWGGVDAWGFGGFATGSYTVTNATDYGLYHTAPNCSNAMYGTSWTNSSWAMVKITRSNPNFVYQVEVGDDVTRCTGNFWADEYSLGFYPKFPLTTTNAYPCMYTNSCPHDCHVGNATVNLVREDWDD
jgi:hypothetical protein